MSGKYSSPLAAQGSVKALVHVLVLLQVLQPALAAAAELAPATAGVTVDHAANGVPLVNIATPNAAGLSVNRYTQFNVGGEGLILNNSAQPVNTQLAGYITGNANLGAGSARLILNEVTAANPSQLNGYMEVAGARAGVVVANPYGISCNGCGFINTSHATLATGTPEWNADGSLAGYRVEEGTLRFDGVGLNADNIDGLALYARVLELNANLYATQLDVVTGRNQVDAASGTATPLAPAALAPAYAIDSSALGGMFANTIRLVGTEAGVGMRLAGPVAALTGQLEILANGDVRLARSSAATTLTVASAGNVALADRMSAGGNVALAAAGTVDLTAGGTVTAPVAVEAGGALQVIAAGLRVGSGALTAARDLTLALPTFDRAASGGSYAAGGRFSILAAGDIVFSGAEVSTPGALMLDSATGAIRIDSRVLSGGDADLRADAIVIGAEGVLASQGALAATADRLDNLGVAYGRDALTLELGSLLANGAAGLAQPAYLLSQGDIHIGGRAGNALAEVSNWGSRIESTGGTIDIAATLIRNLNVGWSLTSEELTPVKTYSPSQWHWENFYGVGISSTSGMHAYRRTYVTTDYTASQGLRGNVVAAGDITLTAGTVENDRSTVSSGEDLLITADHVYNTGTEEHDFTTVAVSDHWHTCSKHSDGNTTCDNHAASFTEAPIAGEAAVVPAILEGRDSAVIIGTTTSCSPGQDGQPSVTCPGEAQRTAGYGYASKWSDVPTGVDGLPPLGGIFHLSSDPAHPYLIETDPALNTYPGFLGSAWLLARLEGWSPDLTQRRLGDGYYELAVIREFLLATLGSRFLDPGIADEKAQFEYLMQNAIAAAESLHLSPGISLSREQIDALQADIVWMEPRTVAGQQVLVPVVYLAQGGTRLLQSGAVIGGGSVGIAGESFINGGLVQARDSLTITTQQDLQNLGGSLVAGGDVTLASAQGDIENVSGHISGADVTLAAAGDIIHRTLVDTQTVQIGAATSTVSSVGDIASVSASGSLSQAAGHDLRVDGAVLTGDNVSLVAGNDIRIGTVQVTQGRSYSSADWQMAEEHVAQLQSQVEAAQRLSMVAGADIAAIGAYLGAGGDIDLSADNISIAATRDASSSSDRTVGDDGYSRSDTQDETVKGGVVQAGGNVTLAAREGDLHLTAAAVASTGGAVTLKASHDIVLDTLGETHYAYFESHSEQSDALTTTVTDVRKLDLDVLARGTTVSGQDVLLHAGNDAALTSAQLVADDHLGVAAGGDLLVRAALDYHDHQESVTRSKSFTGLGEFLMDAVDLMQDMSKLMLVTSQPLEMLSTTWIAEKLELPTPEQLMDALTLSTSLQLSGSRDIDSVQSQSLATSWLHAGRSLTLAAGVAAPEGLAGDADFPVLPAADLAMVGETAPATDSTAATPGTGNPAIAGAAPRVGNITITGSQLTAGALTAPSGDGEAAAGEGGASADAAPPAPGEIHLVASGDIAIGTQQVAVTEYHDRYELDRDVHQLRQQEQSQRLEASYAQGSLLSADAITVAAGRDLAITASNVVAEQDIALAVGGSVTIAGATSSVHSVTENEVQKDGLMKAGTGWGFTAGERIKTATQEQMAELYSGSTVGSVAGNLTIRAGDAAVVEGSTLSAGQDMNVDAARIELLAGREQSEVVDTRRMTEVGITLSAGGTVIDSASAINQSLERADDVENERLERVKQLQAAYKAYQLYKAAAALVASNGQDSSAFRVSLTAGFSVDENSTTSRSDAAISSALLAGGNLSLTARGTEGEGATALAGDILSRGSVISAGNAVTMTAANDIQLLSAASLYTTDREHESFSAGGGVGASVNVGSGTLGAIGATGYASGASSSGDELMLEHQETTLDAASFSFSSGRDTVLRGAVVTADTIAGDVGRDLMLESEQDHITFGSEDMSLGGSVTALVGANVSFSASAGQIRSDYLSVIEQTGLFAGKGGFDLRVGGTTDLTGAVIASTASADKNALDTQSLVYRDIGNHAEWSMEQVTVGTSLNFGLADGDSDSNVTRAAISAGTLTVRDDAATGRDSTAGLLRDAGQAHQVLGQNFDETEARESAELVQAIVDLGTTITRDQRQDAQKALAAQKYLDITEKQASGEELNPEEKAWMQANGASWNSDYAKSVVGGRSREELATSAQRWNTGGAYSLGLGFVTGAAAGGTLGFEQAIGNAFIVASPDVSSQIGAYKQARMEDAGQRIFLAQLKIDVAREQGLDGGLDLLLAQSELQEAQADFESWNNGGLNATLLHTASGALQGLATGNFLGGALSAGFAEGGSPYLEDAPDWLQRTGTIGFGVLGSSYAGSNVFALQGAGTAYTADTYNRYLHDRERKAIMDRVAALTMDSEKRKALYLRIVGEALKELDSQFNATYEQKKDDYAASIFKSILGDPANKGLFDPTVVEQGQDWRLGSAHKEEKQALTNFWEWITPERLGAQDAILLPSKVSVPVAMAKAVVNLPSDAVNLGLMAAEGGYNLVRNGVSSGYELFPRVPDLTESLLGIETTPMEKLVGGLFLVPAGELVIAGREASLARAADEAASAKYLQTLGADNDIWSFQLSGLGTSDAASLVTAGSGVPAVSRVAYWSAESAGQAAKGASPGYVASDDMAQFPDYPSYLKIDFGDFSEGWGVLDETRQELLKSLNPYESVGAAGIYQEGLAFRIDLPEHLAGPDGFTKSGMLSGTHNLQSATDVLDANGATYSLTPTGVTGISELKYSYTNPATGKVVVGTPKTVYDPAIFSDQAMLDYSMRASEDAWGKYLMDPSMTKFDVSHGGINFRAYINFDENGNPFIGNVHPIK